MHIELAFTTTVAFAAVPAQLPDQPVNDEPAFAAAVMDTVVFCGKLYEHALPHAIPTGVELTVPAPVPERVTIRLNVAGGGARLKLAVQVDLVVSVMDVVVAAPPHAPVQPSKMDPALGVAVSAMLA